MFEQVLAQVAALAGFAAAISLIVNVLKYFNLIKEGTAQNWVAGANLLLILAIYGFKLFNVPYDIAQLDPAMQEFATVATYILSFVINLGVSKGTHMAIKGVPVVGKSYSLEASKKE